MATTYTDCLTFTGETSDFTLKAKYQTWDGTLEWSTDHTNWTILNGREEMQSVNKKLYLRGKGNTTFFYEDGEGGAFGVEWQLSSLAKCNGNIQTLLDYSNPPASIPANSCYRFMFNGCSNLTTAPELPATTLSDSCYSEMFNECTRLNQAPELPATTLVSNCYFFMFRNCTSLKISATQSPEYPTAWRIPSSGTISSTPTNWNYSMLSGTGGTFTSNPSINTTYYGAWSLVETYNITYNLTNCTGASTNPTTINEGTTATLSFVSNDGYSFPDTITVSGVESYTWDKSTGTLTLTNATGDVSITINCIVAYPKINSFTYYGKQINNINGKPIRYVHDNRAGANKTYEMVYVVQLATPQNVTANGTTVSWDEVENATSYAVLADGSEIGTVEEVVGYILEAGTYKFIEKPVFGNLLEETAYNFSFTSNNSNFTYVKYGETGSGRTGFMFDTTTVYVRGAWVDQAYRTVTIVADTQVSADFYNWAIADGNLVKQ